MKINDPETQKEILRHRTRLLEFLASKPVTTVQEIREHFSSPSKVPLYSQLLLSVIFQELIRLGTIEVTGDSVELKG